MKTTKDGFCGTVGNTPLIRLESISKLTGCNIYGKAEFLNPGGSVKDRAALGMIEHAERSGLLKPGATIVEGTAGNTGIGLAHVANAKGYKCIIVIPDTQAKEKMDYLRAIGAEVRPVPAAPSVILETTTISQRDSRKILKASGLTNSITLLTATTM